MRCFHYLLPVHLAKGPGAILRVMGRHRNFKGPVSSVTTVIGSQGFKSIFFLPFFLFVNRFHSLRASMLWGAQEEEEERKGISNRLPDTVFDPTTPRL